MRNLHDLKSSKEVTIPARYRNGIVGFLNRYPDAVIKVEIQFYKMRPWDIKMTKSVKVLYDMHQTNRWREISDWDMRYYYTLPGQETEFTSSMISGLTVNLR